MMRCFVWVVLAVVATGCRVVGPNYHRPGLAVPQAHREGPDPAASASLADTAWWEVFRDPALEGLIREALAGNQDLRIAAARVDEVRAGITIACSEGRVQADLELGATRDYRASATSGSEFFDRLSSNYRAAVGATWELDLWGRIRRGSEAAWADYLASEEGRRAVLVTLVGDVATAYFELRALDWQLEIAESTLESRTSTRDLFAKRQEGGLGSELEVARATGDLAGAAADVPALKAFISQRENAISFLLGRSPGPVARGPELKDALVPPEIPAGLPSTLLERRPDVKAAEDALWAATARVGVARAQRFPTVSLTGALGLESADLSDLVSSRAVAWGLGAGLLAPLLNGGRLRAEENAAWARARQAEAQWVKAAQGAFRDVADALAAVRRSREVTVQQRLQVEARRRSLDLGWTRFRGEVASYFEVLDAQRELYPAELFLARARRDEMLAVVALYRALGGGWDRSGFAVCAPPPPPTPPGCFPAPTQTPVLAPGSGAGAPPAPPLAPPLPPPVARARGARSGSNLDVPGVAIVSPIGPRAPAVALAR